MKSIKLTITLLLGSALSACTSVEEEEAVSNRNAQLYNAIDTTEQIQNPGEDTRTLPIRQDSPIAYQEARGTDEVSNEHDAILPPRATSVEVVPRPLTTPLVVRSVQEQLQKRGYTTVVPDGIYGPKTYDALRDFQRQNELIVSGEIDAMTLRELEVQVMPAEEIGPDEMFAE